LDSSQKNKRGTRISSDFIASRRHGCAELARRPLYGTHFTGVSLSS
jgi:hypothetical protein